MCFVNGMATQEKTFPPGEQFFIFINISPSRCVALVVRRGKFINMLLCGDTNYHVSLREEVGLTVQAKPGEISTESSELIMNYSVGINTNVMEIVSRFGKEEKNNETPKLESARLIFALQEHILGEIVS
jgi:hypothetical protein